MWVSYPHEYDARMELKRCCKCHLWQGLDQFGPNKSKTSGLQDYCRDCGKEYQRAHYLKTPEKNPARNATRMRVLKRNMEFLWHYLAEHPCVDCGEADPIVLEFDHVRGEKLYAVSVVASRGFSIEMVVEEIAKCEVRCCNCHRRQTAERGNWYARIDRTILAMEDLEESA